MDRTTSGADAPPPGHRAAAVPSAARADAAPQRADFNRIAIINRGEAAMRLIAAARETNRQHGTELRTIALYTDPDARAMFVREADDALHIGPATYVDERDGQRKSKYLDYAALAAALDAARAEAVWVGWGFVAEHAAFAELCAERGVVFIGPTADVLRGLGDKITAKRVAEKAKVPVAPWSGGPVDTLDAAREHAAALGYPLMVKATAGGGGRGIRRVRREADLPEAFESARAEALKAFGDGTVFLECMVDPARHVEVQLMADNYGTTWALGVRDCTIQRRNQKVVEEAPSPVLTAEQDRALREAAVRLGSAMGYRNAGTVEFLFSPQTQRFSFMEVNARLQVEHPVTEMTTGLDIVKLQLHVARGGRLEGEPPQTIGHAVEVRLNAEDPEERFAPAPGTVEQLRQPLGPGLRVDTGFEEGDVIAPEFDSMIAKIIAHGRDRSEAIARLERGLFDGGWVIRGGTTNKGFLLDLLRRPEVRASEVDVGWLDRLVDAGEHLDRRNADAALIQAAVSEYEADQELQKTRFFASAARGRPEVGDEIGRAVELSYRGNSYAMKVWRLGPHDYRLAIGDETIDVVVERLSRLEQRLTYNGERFRVRTDTYGLVHVVEVDGVPYRLMRDRAGVIRAPSAAVVVSVAVRPGDEVAVGDRLAVVEAMKMEMSILAEFPGRVRQVSVTGNTQVMPGAPLMIIDPLDDGAEQQRTVRVVFRTPTVGASAEPNSSIACYAAQLVELRQAMLGYDASRPSLAVAGDDGPAGDADTAELRALEDQVLTIFVDNLAVMGAYGSQPVGAPERLSAKEYLATYLRDLSSRGKGLPEDRVACLLRALAHYDVRDLEPTAELKESLYRIHVARRHVETHLGSIIAILRRRVDNVERCADELSADSRALLERLMHETQRRFHAVHDCARELYYRCYEQPILEQSRARVFDQVAADLQYLAGNPDAPDGAAVLDGLIRCPQPLKGFFSARLADSDMAAQRVMAEVLLRRYYRTRRLETVSVVAAAGHAVATARYEHEGRRFCVLAAHVPWATMPQVLAELVALVASAPEGDEVLVDLLAWHPQLPLNRDAEALRDQVDQTIHALGFSSRATRVAVAISGPRGPHGLDGELYFTFRRTDDRFAEDTLSRGFHPMVGERLRFYNLKNFRLERLSSVESVYLFRIVAKQNPKDERLIALAEVRDTTPLRGAAGRVVGMPELERVFHECVASIRRFQSRRPPRARLYWNRVHLFVNAPLGLRAEEIEHIVDKLTPAAGGLGLEKVLLRTWGANAAGDTPHDAELEIAAGGTGIVARFREPSNRALEPLSEYAQKVVRLRQRGLVYPYELIARMAPVGSGVRTSAPPGEFSEYDLDESRAALVPVERAPGLNESGVVVGVVRSFTTKHPEGVTRVLILGDASKEMGALAEAECRRVIAALDLAEQMKVPVEWYALSAGAKIAMDSGTENLDWTAAALRRIIEFTQSGGEVNVVVYGVSVGAQSYWNAEATMLMHTRGVLIMTPAVSMVLTGKRALEYSGGVSAEDNEGIGGYDRIMGPNGQAQYFAQDLDEARRILMRYYDHTYVVPGERFPRPAATDDPIDRDVCAFPHEAPFCTVGQVFSAVDNPGRKKPFDIRTVMSAVCDQDHPPLERWFGMRDAEMAVIWDVHVGGHPICLLGLESRQIPRVGPVPADGPAEWTSGTLFPLGSKKVARAINAASGNRPVVVLANLSGFDGSPESMRNLQLEYGAEIGRAVVNFKGPFVFCVISRYHGGAFVVFSNRLNEQMEVAAIEGAYASVIGGAPAAAVVFSREVKERAMADAEVQRLEEALTRAAGADKMRLRAELNALSEAVYNLKIGEVAEEFDRAHDVHRAQKVGSVDHVIAPSELRPYVVAAIRRGLARATQGEPASAAAGPSSIS